MHLLSATPGTISNGEEAIDLDQSPGDMVILTVADSELACFAGAAARMQEGARPVRQSTRNRPLIDVEFRIAPSDQDPVAGRQGSDRMG